MALTINPAVSGSRRDWIRQITAFMSGVWLGGMFSLAIVLALIGALSHWVSKGILVVFAIAVIGWAVAKDAGVPLWLPYRQRQVPEWLREALPGPPVAFLYGSMLGVGFLTLFTYSTQLAFLLALPFLKSGSMMVVSIAAFALGKTIVIATAAGASSTADVAARFHWTPARGAMLRLTTATMSLLVAGALALAYLAR